MKLGVNVISAQYLPKSEPRYQIRKLFKALDLKKLFIFRGFYS